MNVSPLPGETIIDLAKRLERAGVSHPFEVAKASFEALANAKRMDDFIRHRNRMALLVR